MARHAKRRFNDPTGLLLRAECNLGPRPQDTGYDRSTVGLLPVSQNGDDGPGHATAAAKACGGHMPFCWESCNGCW